MAVVALIIIFVACLLQLAASQSVTTLAGGHSNGTAVGSVNGVGSSALFNLPFGVALDTFGTVFVADRLNHNIRAVLPNRTVITLAGGGSSGTQFGSNNGIGSNALFNGPFGVAVDAFGTIFVADFNNHKIRAIFSNLTVITVVGGGASGTLSGSNNGIGSNALFNGTRAGAVDAYGNIFVADGNNHKIRAIFPNLTVITVAGGGWSGTAAGSNNGIGSNALFTNPWGIAMDAYGIIYVGDYGSHTIRAISRTCYPGSYVGLNNSCPPCAAGTFSSAVDSLSCSLCPAGTFSTEVSAESVSTCQACAPGSSSSAGALNCTICSSGTFASLPRSPSCQQCPSGHFCPVNTSSWSRLNCGRGHYCGSGSAAPKPCPYQVPPPGGWGQLKVQGPAFLVETAGCLNHCFWNFTSGDGVLSKCD
jgi:hypothetical protein